MATCLSEGKKRLHIILFTGFLLIPVAMYFVPLDWLRSQHTICLYKNLTGHECYGCGMTRAIFSAIHLKLSDAWHFNRLSVIVIPLLAYIWLKTLLSLLPEEWAISARIRKWISIYKNEQKRLFISLIRMNNNRAPETAS
jgi:hypothetical protein